MVLISLVAGSAMAQQRWGEQDPQRTTFGIRAGLDFHNVVGTDAAGNDLENDLKPAFHIGVVADMPIATDFYIQPGLLWHSKGFQYDDNLIGEAKVSIHYLELPVTLLYKPMVGNGNLVLGFGPYLAYGIGGKAKFDEGDDQDVKFENEVGATDSDAVYFRPWEAGANFTVGYQFMGNLSAQLHAQLGLTDINPDIEGGSSGETSYKNIGFGISLGYHF